MPVLTYLLLFFNVTLFHCRSYPAALPVLMIKRLFSETAFIFDPRSDYAEESALQENWSAKNINYEMWKYFEKKICKFADTVVVIGAPFNAYIQNINNEAVTQNIYNNVNAGKFFSTRFTEILTEHSKCE
jgi:hypothetical protein